MTVTTDYDNVEGYDYYDGCVDAHDYDDDGSYIN